MNLAQQLMNEIQSKSDKINQLKYGELSLVVQDGRLVRWDMKEQFKIKADSNNERLRR